MIILCRAYSRYAFALCQDFQTEVEFLAENFFRPRYVIDFFDRQENSDLTPRGQPHQRACLHEGQSFDTMPRYPDRPYQVNRII